jgi:hypothetical protein
MVARSLIPLLLLGLPAHSIHLPSACARFIVGESFCDLPQFPATWQIARADA